MKTEFAALPNVLAQRQLVPELMQDAATPEALAEALSPLLEETTHRAEQRAVFDQIHRQLRCGAAQKAAEALLALADA